MPITSLYDEHGAAGAEKSATVPVRAVVVVVAAVAAAWIAAGSTGLLAQPLRHALCWAALAVAVVAGWPRRDESLIGWLALAVAVVLGLIMTASSLPVVNVLAVTLVTAALVRSPASLRGRAILIAVLATAVLGIFRLASTSVPTVWLMADALGGALGRLAGRITDQPLWVGATFGGVDFLVLMAALYVGWLICTSPPRLPRAIYAAAAILFGHLIYLVVLSFSDVLLSMLPDPVIPEISDNSRVGVWAWGNAVRTLLPWNLPLLAAVIHAAIALVMFRWAGWSPVSKPAPGDVVRHGQQDQGVARPTDALLRYGPAVLAVLIPLLTVLGLSDSNLEEETEGRTEPKTILAYEQGYLDWDKPEHDSETAGAYGMLKPLVESLGGRLETSAKLSAEDLKKAGVLLLLHPNRPWPKQRLQRLREFVRGGGSLLLAAEPKVLEIASESTSESTFNEVLKPAEKWGPAMEVRQDTAISKTGHWEHSLEPLAHPTTAGIGDRRNRLGLWMGSSIDLRWPARPLLVGRYAWSDSGSDAARTYRFRYDPGEKLGDVVLAAEQRLGKGRIVVLGDATSLNNAVIANSYMFTGRLLGYLAGDARSPQAGWRQLLGLLAMAALVGLLAWRASAPRVGVAAVLLSASLASCVGLSHWAARVLPDGRHDLSPNTLAYIDASHLEAYSSDTWGDFGLGGLARTLTRNGYLPLFLPELTAERLERAGLLISIAPARRFSEAERAAVGSFVKAGGSFICTVGSEEAAASRELLDELGFEVPPSPMPPSQSGLEPEPLGAFQTLYINYEDREAAVQSYAGWQVECRDEGRYEMAKWSNAMAGQQRPERVIERPFVVSRQFGKGTVAVIGDTYMAVNQNLESAGDVIPENVVFWRWFVSRVTDREPWTPPKKNGKPATPDELPPEDPPDGGPDEEVPP